MGKKKNKMDNLLNNIRTIHHYANIYLQAIAFSGVYWTLISNVLAEIFSLECKRCNGMGKIVCKKCRGTKTLARRPTQKVPILQVYNRRRINISMCFVCGSNTPSDEEDDLRPDRMREIIMRAYRNHPEPKSELLDGSIKCPSCDGKGSLINFELNPKILYDFEEKWYIKPLRKGYRTYAPPGWPQPHSKYIECSGKHCRPITEREIGYFGSNVFDYKDEIDRRSAQTQMNDFDT